MELQHFSHNHPLVFNEGRSHESEKAVCSGCEEVISGPRFSCVTWGFHLDNNCAKAPSEVNHPFHRNHSLILLGSSPYKGSCICNFCDKYCKKFVYHCSCKLDLHIKCALFLYDLEGKKIGYQIQNVAYKDPSISSENHSEELKEAKCFACWEPLLDSTYLSLDSGFYLHMKCIELPFEINHLTHRQHSLFLQYCHLDLLPCKICDETQPRGLVYCCSICKFVLHLKCVSPSLIIEDANSHEHPFTRWLRPSSFTCDACGTSGNYVAYICSTCSLILHEKCIWLPRIIKIILHHHPIFHKYFVADNEPGTLECEICHEEVNKECGSYYCSECRFIIHVHCALQNPRWYYEIDPRKLNENAILVEDTMGPSFFVIKEIRLGEKVINTEIKHFSHQHNLVLDDEEKDHRFCDGCSQLIASSFYRCLQCDFFLHKSCAELPRKKHIWFILENPFHLVSDGVFKCDVCKFWCSGFSYLFNVNLVSRLCVRCAGLSRDCTQGHEHRLLYYHEYNGQCNACGVSINGLVTYRCKGCDFNVHYYCTTILPQIATHQCDEHFLTLTYHEDNDYSDYHYCDICEQKRNPNYWFYHCAICDTSAHPKCVLGDYRFIKLGTSIFIGTYHPHSLVFVQKVYHYTECCKCGKPCLGLALECPETRCHYNPFNMCKKFSGYTSLKCQCKYCSCYRLYIVHINLSNLKVN